MKNRTEDSSRTASAPRVVGWLALAGVSLIAGIASYFHALAVVQDAGATAPVSYLVPALADLVILGASADLLAASRARQHRPALTMLTLAVGVGVTLAMNVAAGGGHGLGGRLVSGWPALAFTLALESLAGLVRRGREGAATPAFPAVLNHGETAETPTREHLILALAETGTRKEVSQFVGISPSKLQRLVSEARRALQSVPDEAAPETPEAAPDSAEPSWDGTFELAAGADQGRVPAALNGSAPGAR